MLSAFLKVAYELFKKIKYEKEINEEKLYINLTDSHRKNNWEQVVDSIFNFNEEIDKEGNSTTSFNNNGKTTSWINPRFLCILRHY